MVRFGASDYSQASLYCKRGQDQYHGVDQSPNKGYPRRHLEVACLIDTTQSVSGQHSRMPVGTTLHSQSAHNTPRKNALNARYHCIDERRDPYDLPVPPLDDAGPGSDDHVHGAEEQQGPYGGEAPDVAGIVEVLGHGDVGRHGPVERGEVGDLVVGRGGAADALDEAGGISK
jgi:hypothetical protein